MRWKTSGTGHAYSTESYVTYESHRSNGILAFAPESEIFAGVSRFKNGVPRGVVGFGWSSDKVLGELLCQ